jgi:hypothetical protein
MPQVLDKGLDMDMVPDMGSLPQMTMPRPLSLLISLREMESHSLRIRRDARRDARHGVRHDARHGARRGARHDARRGARHGVRQIVLQTYTYISFLS